ncbi:MAG: hypothetical protein K9L85_03605 [Candidatus Peribacteraceae bacterium]|nr:hypothetical protein [Candidatus Peribacteraceae bacterium]
MKKLLLIFVTAVLLAGCAPAEVTISETEYKQALGFAVCDVVNELNARGELADEEAMARDFDKLLEESLNRMSYDSDEWLAAKAKYFPDEEEHTKLVKLHFTWCLLGGSIGGEDELQAAE